MDFVVSTSVVVGLLVSFEDEIEVLESNKTRKQFGQVVNET